MKQEVPKTAQFDMSIADGHANVKRDFEFKAARIKFDIAVPIKEEASTVTVAELHRRSVEMVISLLQGLIPPQK